MAAARSLITSASAADSWKAFCDRVHERFAVTAAGRGGGAGAADGDGDGSDKSAREKKRNDRLAAEVLSCRPTHDLPEDLVWEHALGDARAASARSHAPSVVPPRPSPFTATRAHLGGSAKEPPLHAPLNGGGRRRRRTLHRAAVVWAQGRTGRERGVELQRRDDDVCGLPRPAPAADRVSGLPGADPERV